MADRRSRPAVSGVIRTRLLVPSWMLSLPWAQRTLVLLHEQEHIRAWDPMLMALARLVRTLSLDEATATVAEAMRFTPAMNRDQRVPVSVQIPIRFQVLN